MTGPSAGRGVVHPRSMVRAEVEVEVGTGDVVVLVVDGVRPREGSRWLLSWVSLFVVHVCWIGTA